MGPTQHSDIRSLREAWIEDKSVISANTVCTLVGIVLCSYFGAVIKRSMHGCGMVVARLGFTQEYP